MSPSAKPPHLAPEYAAQFRDEEVAAVNRQETGRILAAVAGGIDAGKDR
jgi:hypothetical protein